ncbi:MAG: gluconokinase [Alphaproteobacteria bacterium]|nr:gluconokinase [Alphaproteobacteria bacterium]
MIVVVMGVSGVGKTTVGRTLAERLNAVFLEGDRFHPPANVAKMSAGTPLTDDDREPWLRALAAEAENAAAQGRNVVVACSALKRAYRRILTERAAKRFVHLTGDPALIKARLDARVGHYMPPSLLPSQLAALEPPGAEEGAVVVDIAPEPSEQIDRILAALSVPA